MVNSASCFLVETKRHVDSTFWSSTAVDISNVLNLVGFCADTLH